MTRDKNPSSSLAQRTVFNGINAEQMFTAEIVPLPELMSGEILVKVI
jgi:hypothetical protein